MTKQVVLLAVLCAQVLSLLASPDEVCLEELGCIPLRDCPQRVLLLKPDPRLTINTQFLFYSRETLGKVPKISGHDIKPRVLRGTTFSPARSTKVVVHGYLDNVLWATWMTELKDALLENGDFNVILVDWSGGNGLPYVQASVNTRLVGAEIGLLIKKLVETFGISPSDVHVYGHSLGGHVAGYAGKWLNGTLGRITALDPAEPLFQFCPPEARISKTDAQFVEVVHTDATTLVAPVGFGMDIAVGDVDFYPNGGKRMPGCDMTGRFIELKDKSFLDGARLIASCNHLRAIEYTRVFLENSAKDSTCLPIAFACQNYDIFEAGHCSDCGLDGSRCAVMTLEGADYIRKLRGKSNDTVQMYFKTGTRPPYCLYHYNIEMKLYRDPQNAKVQPVAGTLSIVINVENGRSHKFDLKHESSGDDFTPGATYRYLITSEVPVENVESITFNYSYWMRFFAPQLYLRSIKFTPITATSTRIDLRKLSKTFCPKNNAIESRRATTLEEEFC